MRHYLVIILLFAATRLPAEAPPIMRGADAARQNLLLVHPRPEYPYAARLKFITGSGVFELRFAYETGHLREIHVASSTGSPILDASVIRVLKRWEAKPHSLHRISVPVTFRM